MCSTLLHIRGHGGQPDACPVPRVVLLGTPRRPRRRWLSDTRLPPAAAAPWAPNQESRHRGAEQTQHDRARKHQQAWSRAVDCAVRRLPEVCLHSLLLFHSELVNPQLFLQLHLKHRKLMFGLAASCGIVKSFLLSRKRLHLRHCHALRIGQLLLQGGICISQAVPQCSQSERRTRDARVCQIAVSEDAATDGAIEGPRRCCSRVSRPSRWRV